MRPLPKQREELLGLADIVKDAPYDVADNVDDQQFSNYEAVIARFRAVDSSIVWNFLIFQLI